MTSYETLSEIEGFGAGGAVPGLRGSLRVHGHASYRLPLGAFRELGRMVQDAVNHPAMNSEKDPRYGLSILDGRLRIGPNSEN